jgi:hypothetical protein
VIVRRAGTSFLKRQLQSISAANSLIHSCTHLRIHYTINPVTIAMAVMHEARERFPHVAGGTLPFE